MRKIKVKSGILVGAILLCGLSALGYGVQSGYGSPSTEYALDPAHSRIGFSVGHLGISTVSGHFREYAGTLSYKPGERGHLKADATIAADTIDTGVEARDRHLRGEDFFLVEEYPEITYQAKSLERDGDKWLLTGAFTMRGVERELTIPVTINGPVEDPWGNQRIALKGEVVIDRRDFNVGSEKISDRLVGREVTIELTLQGIAQSDE